MPLVLVVSHCLALLLIDDVVDVLSQSIVLHFSMPHNVVMCAITSHVNQMT